MIDCSTRQHGGNVYEAVRKRGGSLSRWLDFSANINPLGLSPRIREALLDHLEAVVHYPDPEATEFRQVYSSHYTIPAECVEAGNGAVELIYLVCRVVSPKRVVLVHPSFSEYGAAARSAGLPVGNVFLKQSNGFALPVEELVGNILAADLLFLCNPNNPTGTVLDSAELEPIIRQAALVGAHVVVDESFIDFRPEGANESCRGLLAKYPCLLILHSLTKFLAIPGLRLGVMLGVPDIMRRMKNLRDPWNVNVLAQAAGVAGLHDAKFRRDCVDLVQTEKDRLFHALGEISGVEPFYPAVNFILADIRRPGWDAGRLQEALWQDNILIRNCSNFVGLSPSFFRVAVRATQENGVLIGALRKILCGEDVR